MEREDTPDALWPWQLPANCIFTASLSHNNPFGNPEACLPFTSAFQLNVWGLAKPAGALGLQAQRCPDGDSLQCFPTAEVSTSQA